MKNVDQEKGEVKMRETAIQGIKNKLKSILIGILVGALFTGITAAIIVYKANEPKVTVSYIGGKLEDIGELATQRLIYTSSVPMKEGSIPFITKKEFTMKYNASVVAGIEMDKMHIDIKDTKVIVSVPHTKVLGTPHVDPNSIKFLDEKKAILNWQTKDDTKKAIKLAEANIEDDSSINLDSLLERGDQNLETIIHGLLDDSVGKRLVEVKFID